MGLEPHAQRSAPGYQNDTTADNDAPMIELPAHGLGYVLAGCRKRVALHHFFDDVLVNLQRLVFGSLNPRMVSFSLWHEHARWAPSGVLALRDTARVWPAECLCCTGTGS